MKRRISSNTNLIAFSRDGNRSMDEIIPIMAECGFKDFDLNLCEMMRPSSPLLEIGFGKDYIKRLIKIKEEYGLNYYSCHLPYQKSGEENPLTELSLKWAEELSVKIAVIHPLYDTFDNNLRYFERLLKNTPESIILAVENMEDETEFSASPSLKRLALSFKGRMGVCLDTGHLNIRGGDFKTFINDLKGLIIQTHINDNDSLRDQHLLPTMGTTNWKSVVNSLESSGYSGYLNYEAMYFMKALPRVCEREVTSLSYKIGKWLLSLLD